MTWTIIHTLISLLKRILYKNKFFYKHLKKIYRKIKNIPSHPLQNIPDAKDVDFIDLGSDGCGWTFVHTKNLHNCKIISAGLGEDASFDIEFAKKYDAKVIIVDPTPRAIKHFNQIIQNLGQPKTESYSITGEQPIAAYDLTNLRKENLTLIDKALWNENTELKFYEPSNPNHVSHSISNYQNDYRNDSPYLKVQAINLPTLLSNLDLNPKDISLIKLDIEGAEIEVLSHCLALGIRPEQILVEFDELNHLKKKGVERVDRVHENLVNEGYRMVNTDGQANFLYLKKD